MSEATPYVSSNPVFVNFAIPSNDGDVAISSTDQKSASLLKKLAEPNGAKMGYGVGYAGTAPAVAGNIKWDGTDIPFADPMANIPWGEVVLCEGTVSDGKLSLTIIDNASEASRSIHGVCYGTTIKDCSVQLNAGISIAKRSENKLVERVEGSKGLYIAVLVNAVIDADGVVNFTDGHSFKDGDSAAVTGAGKASTVVAVSDAIDPTVFNLSADGMQFIIPASTRGFQFVVTGTLLKAPNFTDPGAYSSYKDTVSSFGVALSVVDAKADAAGSNG